jgi:hypothetical protein
MLALPDRLLRIPKVSDAVTGPSPSKGFRLNVKCEIV